jgi:hypothetical protein
MQSVAAHAFPLSHGQNSALPLPSIIKQSSISYLTIFAGLQDNMIVDDLPNFMQILYTILACLLPEGTNQCAEAAIDVALDIAEQAGLHMSFSIWHHKER